MKNRFIKTPGLALSLLLFSANCPAESSGYCSPVALVGGTSEHTVFVADGGCNAILSVDLSSGEILSRFPLQFPPSGLVYGKQKNVLWVTPGVPEGKTVGLDPGTGKELFSLPAGHTPCSPVLSPDENTLYVCNRFDNRVAAYDLESLGEKWKTQVPREPVAAALTPDGSKLVVANLLPTGTATERPFSAAVSVIGTGAGKLLANISLPNGSTALLGVAIPPNGRYAYVTHTVGRYQSPTKQLDFGWMNTNAFSVIDLSTLKTVATVLLDDLELGAANPWGISCSADGKTLVVAHAGSQELSLVDLKALHAKLDRLAAGEAVSRISTELACVQNDLEFLNGLRFRVPVPGIGPRALLVSGNQVIAGEYFSGELAVLDLASPSRITEIPLAPPQEPDQTRRGEMLFYSATQCYQHWQSCASCHPDARMDGFNWDLLNDGNGNPKNVKSMLFVHRTPPAMWMGVRENAESAVRAGFRYIEFATVPEEDAQAVDSYLKSLKPIPGPVATNPIFRDSIARGKKAFEESGCARCHSGEFFTDGKAHNVGTTTKGTDAGKPVITPSLIECWRTAPYLHDGRDASLASVIKDHGQAGELTQEEQNDLINYLLSL